jgi:hypothetical protein
MPSPTQPIVVADIPIVFTTLAPSASILAIVAISLTGLILG